MYGAAMVIDGFISSVAALCAEKLCPKCSDFMIASHVSKESCTADILKLLGKKAPINADMCLGEGQAEWLCLPHLIPQFAYITKCLLLTILTLKAIRSLNNVYTCNRRQRKRKV